MKEKIPCGGLIERRGLTLIEIMGYVWQPGHSCGILGYYAEAGIALGYLSIGHTADGLRNMAFCIATEAMDRSRELLERVQETHAPSAVRITDQVTILTLYGPHFYERVALASEVYGSLCSDGIDALSLGSSVNSISLVVTDGDVRRTRKSFARRFAWPE